MNAQHTKILDNGFSKYQYAVVHGLSSIFSVDDVVTLLHKVREEIISESSTIVEDKKPIEQSYIIRKDRMDVLLERIQSEICDSIDQIDEDDIVTNDDISLEINYSREIEVTIDGINREAIKDAVENGIEEFRSVWEEEMKELQELEDDNSTEEEN